MTVSLFRWLLFCCLILDLLAVVIAEFSFYSLPNELQTFITKEELSDANSPMDWIMILSSFFLVIYSVFVFIQIYKLNKNAPFHAIFVTVLAYLFSLNFDYDIRNSFSAILFDIGNMLWGGILTILLFSKFNIHFDKNFDKKFK